MPPEKLLSCPFCNAIAQPHDGDFSITHANECFFTQQYAQETWIVSDRRRQQWNARASTPSPELVELRKLVHLHLGNMLDETLTTHRGDWPRHLYCNECDVQTPNHNASCKIGQAYNFWDLIDAAIDAAKEKK